MRALILILAVVVIGLSVSILLEQGSLAPKVPLFRPALLISDATKGEQATYVDGEGHQILYRVERATPGGIDNPPWFHIRRELRDATGRLLSTVTYDHVPTMHSLFPLVAPEDPEGYDRVWIWQRIRQETITVGGKRRLAWRIDCIDPALQPDADSVVAWVDPEIPVFGLLRWQRGGRTWSLVGTGN